MHEVLQKLLASYRLQGVPDDLTQVQHPLFTHWWHFSCHVAGLVWEVSASRALICTRSCKKLLASYRLQGVPDDLAQVQHPLFTRWWHFSCHVAGLVWDVSASRALICSRLQIPVCKGFPMTLHRCSILCSPAGGTFLATLPVLSGMSVHQGL